MYGERGKKSSGEKFVYFIQDGDSGPIKIGASARPLQRMVSFQLATWRELRHLGICEGGTALEHELHVRFRSDEIAGEWFQSSPALLEYIAQNAHPIIAPALRMPKVRVHKIHGLRRDKSIAFRVNPDDACAIRAAAKEAGVKVSELIRRYIDEYLEATQ